MRHSFVALVILCFVLSTVPLTLRAQQNHSRAPRLSAEGTLSTAIGWSHQTPEGLGLTVELPSDAVPVPMPADLQRKLGKSRRFLYAGSGWSLVLVRTSWPTQPTTRHLKDLGNGILDSLSRSAENTDFNCSLQPVESDRVKLAGSMKRRNVPLNLDGYVSLAGMDTLAVVVTYHSADEGAAAIASRVLGSVAPN